MRRAFTLIEILVVAAIVALLAAVLLPALKAARDQGKRAACLANLNQLALATAMYLDENRDHFWRYYQDIPGGRLWWFGYEPGGPAYTISHRPLDKSRGALARYMRSTDDGLQCPAFPYQDGCYYPKFAARSASYGYNLRLGPANPALPTRRRDEFQRRLPRVFVFADGVHFDFDGAFNPRMNEGHYIDYVDDPTNPFVGGGYGHFRHRRRAEVLYMDGHVEGQPLRGPAYAGPPCAGIAGNLSTPAGGNTLYGF